MAALGAVLAVVAGMFATLLLTTRSLDATSRSGRSATQMQHEASQLERTAVDLETGVRGYLITRDPEYLDPYERGRRSLAAHVHQLLVLTTPEQRGHVLAIRNALGDYVRNYAEPLVRSATPHDAALLESSREGKRRLDAIRAQFATFNRTQERVTAQRRDRSQSLRHRMLPFAAWRAPPGASPRASWARASPTPAAARSASWRPPSTRWPARSPPARRTCACRPTGCRGSSTTRRPRSRSRTATAATWSPTPRSCG
jgi:CHASE3 domain sensor protein